MCAVVQSAFFSSCYLLLVANKGDPVDLTREDYAHRLLRIAFMKSFTTQPGVCIPSHDLFKL